MDYHLLLTCTDRCLKAKMLHRDIKVLPYFSDAGKDLESAQFSE